MSDQRIRSVRRADPPTVEHARLEADNRGEEPWKRWGPYLSERQWGTVREDYSAEGAAWSYFPHDHARSRAYRWGEDGIAGLSDDEQRFCFALAFWNGRDPILKERLFGLTNREGNHGEDVKECYYLLDSTPTHSWMRMLYKYPQSEFPYEALAAENRRRSRTDPEYELSDTGVFDEGRYFDIVADYAKAGPEDILIRISAHNRGPERAPLEILPHLWFRNTWSWDLEPKRPQLAQLGPRTIEATHPDLGTHYLYCDGGPELVFTDNETNGVRLFGIPAEGHFKDAFHEYVVEGRDEAINPHRRGTKAAARYVLEIDPGRSAVIRLRLVREWTERPFPDFDELIARREQEADAFYDWIAGPRASAEDRLIQRQAYAGLLWTKQFYYYDLDRWLEGDPGQPPPPERRTEGRNDGWEHLHNADIVSMPDTWEYPWYAAWDLAFHCVALAPVDPEFAKEQLVLLTREWYMHPNGQLPAYEWSLEDVNPPVHAWGAWRVYEIDKERNDGVGDTRFLERIFHKLLLNFTWWVNRKDEDDRNVFQGGFLGLDNIGVFDRSQGLPEGGHLDQADGTAWMAMYSLNLMRIAIELALSNPVYEDTASKFFEHFLYIAAALNNLGGEGIEFWDPVDEFFYDVLHGPDGSVTPLRVRSMVGLVPLFAVEIIESDHLEALPGFRERLEWFLERRPELAALVSRWQVHGKGHRHLLALLRVHRMKRVLQRMLDESEFLSDFGVRSLSRYHRDHPFEIRLDGVEHTVAYEPAESSSAMFGGNSNWRGPVWFPVNHLIIESLREFHRYYGDDFKVECPTGSGVRLNLDEVADELCRRLGRLFRRDESGRRPVFGSRTLFQEDPHFRDHILFYEYFNGDTGEGLGASHQTGWTALAASHLAQAPTQADGGRRGRR